MGLSKSVFRQFVKKRSQKRSQKKKKRIREKVDADEERLKKTQFQGRVFLALPKSLLAQGLRFSFSEEKRNKNLPKWCFSDPAPRTSKWLSTKTTTRSCCTSHLRSPTRRFWLALTPSRSLSRRSRPRPEHRLERARAMEPDQVARTFHFRHKDLQVRRYRRKRHQEAVQIRRQVVRQEVNHLYDRE